MTEPFAYRGAIHRNNDALRTWLARQEPEDMIEPDLPIGDPHHHLWETPQRGRRRNTARLGMLHFGFDFHLRDHPPSSAELAQTWRPYVETCIEAFGPRRAMFASNFPPDKQSCSYLTLWNAYKRIVGAASADEKAELFAGTATRVYRL